MSTTATLERLLTLEEAGANTWAPGLASRVAW